jgi:hypothetical protein
VGLTAEVELSLRDTGLIKFFEDNEAAFTEMFKASYAYVEGYVQSVRLPVRRDDVAKNLVPALNANEAMREYLAGKKLRQAYWYRHFADLMCDRLWEEDGEEDDSGQAG